MKIGDTVQLKATVWRSQNVPAGREDNWTAEIVDFVGENGVELNRQVNGFRYWDIDELEIVE